MSVETNWEKVQLWMDAENVILICARIVLKTLGR